MTRLHRNVNIAAVVLPFAAVLAAIPMLWNDLIGWSDLLLFCVMYFVSTAGVTVGYHRLLTHRAFQTYKPIEYLFAAFGSMAVEGPVIGWVSDHRRLTRTPTRTATRTARTDMATASAARCAASGTRTSAGCSTTRPRRTPTSTRPTWSRTAACA